MLKKTAIIIPDTEAFQAAMTGVRPLKLTKTILSPIVKSPSRAKPVIHDAPLELAFSDHEYLAPVDSLDELHYACSGVQHKMLRKLRGGQYNVEAILDLHGQTIDTARLSLSEFLLDCQRLGYRHILIVHGKGRGTNKPILKNKLNHWLRDTNLVLAFSSATPNNGSSGALYVLLRRK
jgi:DNA-nicking Smr family endonuclease